MTHQLPAARGQEVTFSLRASMKNTFCRHIMDKDSCCELIRLYGSKVLLWNSKSPWYRNKAMRDDAWKEISAEMGLPMALLKKKMITLMSSYRRERWRLNRKSKIGSGQGVYRSKWFAYKEFSFMRKKLPEDTRDEIKKTIKQETVTESEEEDPIANENHPTIEPNQGENEMRAINIVAGSQTDPYFTFGQNLANELRKYDQRTLIYVKRAINNVIFEADLGKYAPKRRKDGSSSESIL